MATSDATKDHMDLTIDTPTDIDQSVNELICQIEKRWKILGDNYNNVIEHLQDCNQQVLESSNQCLEALDLAVDGTCNATVNQIKTFNNLTYKCDQLGIDLRPAEDLRDETKSLRKSIDALAKLYRSRPKKG